MSVCRRFASIGGRMLDEEAIVAQISGMTQRRTWTRFVTSRVALSL